MRLEDIIQRQRDLDLQRVRVDLSDRETEFYLHFNTAGSRFLISITLVKEITELLPIKIYPQKMSGHIGVVNLRGSLIPVLSMFRFTGIPEAEEVAAARQGMRDHRLIVISFSETTQFAIIATQTKKTSLPPDIQITDRIVNIDHHPTRVIVPADFFEEREKSNAA